MGDAASSADVSTHQEHPTPTCPNCNGERTRPLDEDVATCFDCDAGWYYEEDYSDFWEDSHV